MALIITNDENFTNIANAIRGKNGLSTNYKPSQMAQAITDIPSGGISSGENTVYEEIFTSSNGSKYKHFGTYGCFYPLDDNGNTFSFRLNETTEHRFVTKFKITEAVSKYRIFYGHNYPGNYGQLPIFNIQNDGVTLQHLNYQLSLNT